MLEKVQEAKAKAKKAQSEPKQKPVPVESRLRKLAAYSWFEEAAARIKAAAIHKKREEKQKDGPKLSPKDLTAVADELERVQRELNPLLARKDELSARLVAHWAHTGVEEIQGTLGKTRITASMSLCVDPDPIRKGVAQTQWDAVTRRILQAPLVLAMALKEKKLQPIIGRATVATNVKVSVFPPSSRSPKKGESQDEAE